MITLRYINIGVLCDRMERLDIKGKFKTFITDSKQKLLSPGSLGSGADGEDWQLILPQVILNFCLLLDFYVALFVHPIKSTLFRALLALTEEIGRTRTERFVTPQINRLYLLCLFVFATVDGD